MAIFFRIDCLDLFVRRLCVQWIRWLTNYQNNNFEVKMINRKNISGPYSEICFHGKMIKSKVLKKYKVYFYNTDCTFYCISLIYIQMVMFMNITLWIEHTHSKTSRISFHDKISFEKLKYAPKLMQKMLSICENWYTQQTLCILEGGKISMTAW